MATHRRHQERFGSEGSHLIDYGLEHFVNAVNTPAAGCDRHPLAWLETAANTLSPELLGNSGPHVADFQVVKLLAHWGPAREVPTLKDFETHLVLHWCVCASRSAGAQASGSSTVPDCRQ
jgi:hypothetical protein